MKDLLQSVLEGDLNGDEEVLYDPDEYPPDYDPGESVDGINDSDVSWSSASSASGSGSTVPPLLVVAFLSSLSSWCSRYLPRPSSVRWSRIPSGTVMDTLDTGTLVIDPAILPLRQARFRLMATIFYDMSMVEIRKLSPKKFDSFNALTSWFMTIFLFHCPRESMINVLCSAVLPEAQYILADPDMVPEDLLQLPLISEWNFHWGCYFDLLTDKATGMVKAWYCGSATAYGNKQTLSGLLGRLLSYFPTDMAEKRISHDDWIRGSKSKLHDVNSRKVADLRNPSTYQRVWTYFLERFRMAFVGLNQDYNPTGREKYWKWTSTTTPG